MNVDIGSDTQGDRQAFSLAHTKMNLFDNRKRFKEKNELNEEIISAEILSQVQGL